MFRKGSPMLPITGGRLSPGDYLILKIWGWSGAKATACIN